MTKCLQTPLKRKRPEARWASDLPFPWWRRWGSNPRPSACKADALPAELRPRARESISPLARIAIARTVYAGEPGLYGGPSQFRHLFGPFSAQPPTAVPSLHADFGQSKSRGNTPTVGSTDSASSLVRAFASARRRLVSLTQPQRKQGSFAVSREVDVGSILRYVTPPTGSSRCDTRPAS